MKEKVTDRPLLLDLPTGGTYRMKEGRNVVYFTKTLAFGKQLRIKVNMPDYLIYHCFSENENQFRHPKDGVFPEKAKEGRLATWNTKLCAWTREQKKEMNGFFNSFLLFMRKSIFYNKKKFAISSLA